MVQRMTVGSCHHPRETWQQLGPHSDHGGGNSVQRGKRPFKDETCGTWKWLGLGKACKRERGQSQWVRFLGPSKEKLAYGKVMGSILNVWICGAVQGTDGDRGWDKTGDLAWTCHQCMEAWVWVKSPGEPIKGEEKRSQHQVQRKSNHPGEEDKGWTIRLRCKVCTSPK